MLFKEQMNVTRRLISGSILRNLEFLITVLITLVMSPFIIHSLGDRMYGFWTLIGTFMGYYGLLDFGLTSAANRFISQSIGRNDKDELSRVATTSFYLFWAIGLAALVLTAILAFVAGFFIDNPEELSLFRQIIAITGVTLAVGFPMRVYNGILVSYLRYDYITFISIFKALATNAIIYASLQKGHGLLALAVINFAGSTAGYLMMYASCRRLYPDIDINRVNIDRSRVRSMFGYSWKSFVAQVADLLRFRVDSFVIAGFLNLSLVTYYSVGARLMEYFVQFMVSCMGLMMPVFSQYEGRNDYRAIRKSLVNSTKISTALAVFIGASIVFYGKPFIERWMGPEFDSSYQVAVILVVPYVVALSQTPSINLLYGISKHHYYAVSNTSEGILNLLLSLILVKSYGIFGVALGTAIGMIIFKIFIQPVYVCRAISLSLKDYYVDTIVLTALKILVPLAIFFYMVRHILYPDYAIILTLAVVQTIVFLPIVYYLVLGKNERTELRQALNLT